MGLTIQRVARDVYQRFLHEAGSSDGILYHHPLWLDAVEEGLGLELILLGIYADNELISVLPGFVKQKGPARLFGSPLRGTMTPYLGWLNRQENRPDTQAVLEKIYRFCSGALGCHYVEIGFPESPSDSAGRPVPEGWHTGERQTYVLDLRGGEEALWKNLEQRGRSHVKKARKSGVVVESLTDRRVIDDFYPMLQASFRRHQAVSPHPKRFFEALHERLVPNARMQVLAARHEGRIIAMGLFAHNQHEIHFVSGASLAEYHHVYPNNLMHWQVIESSTQRGLTKYDFGGKGQPGIDKFKETFGPRVHAYASFWRASRSLTLARHLAVRAWPRVQTLRYHVQQILQPAAK